MYSQGGSGGGSGRGRMLRVFAVVIWLAAVVTVGCTESDTGREKAYIARVGDRLLTAWEFKQAFEVAKVAYPGDIDRDPEFEKKAQIRLLGELIEEMILLQEADRLNIGLTDADLEQAVAKIRGDYPQGAFEETLLKNDLSYHVWKERLKNRLIVERVIDQALTAEIRVSEEEIIQYYHGDHIGYDRIMNKDGISAINESVRRHLRRQKSEQAYWAWMESLKSKYSIEINTG